MTTPAIATQLKPKCPDLKAAAYGVPEWQKHLIDFRLQSTRENPDRILPINSLIEELERGL